MAFPYDGHVAAIEIPEWLLFLPLRQRVQIPGESLPLLNRRLCQLRLAVRIGRVSELNAYVTTGIDVIVADYLAECVCLETSRLSDCFRRYSFERTRHDPRGPDQR